jgi:hypothetical protein
MPDNSGVKSSHWLDKAAVVLSGLCLVHCLALPAVIMVLPLAGELVPGHLHALMLVLVVPVSVLAFVLGFRRHRRWAVPAAGTVGLGLLIVGGTVAHVRYGLAADRAFTIAGSVALAVTHYYNSRWSRHASRRAS